MIKQYPLKIERDLFATLEEAAARSRRSVNQEILHRLETSLDAELAPQTALDQRLVDEALAGGPPVKFTAADWAKHRQKLFGK